MSVDYRFLLHWVGLYGFGRSHLPSCGGEFGGEGSPCENASCAAPCLGDFTNDDAVGFDDLLYLLSDWAGTEADLDGSGVTDFADVLILLAAYGPC